MALTTTRLRFLAPFADVGDLEKVPDEILEKILGYALPSGKTYRFNGFSNPEVKLRRTKVPGLFHVNRKMRELAAGPWVRQNTFHLIAQNIPSGELKRVRLTESVEPLENDVEANVRQISRISQYTPEINVILRCQGSVWRLLSQFFAVFQLQHEHKNEIPVTINGARPSRHPTELSKASGIHIQFPGGARKPEMVLLEFLDLAYEARASKMSLGRLKIQWDECLRSDACTTSMNAARPSVFRTIKHFNLMHDIKAYHGPYDLLYEKVQGAAAARRAANSLEPISTNSMSRNWVTTVIASLRVWSGILRVHGHYLETSKRGGHPYVLPTYQLPSDSIFKHYGDEVWFSRPTTMRKLNAHIDGCETLLFRTEAHIAAMLRMLPYTT